MSTLRFEPIAIQLGKHTSPALLFPADLLDSIRAGELLEDGDPAWTQITREFVSHYAAVAGAGHLLLGSPPFERLSRVYDELNDDYQDEERGSPVYDSHLVQHVLAGVPQGVAGETPYSVLAWVARGDAARARLQELAQSLAGSHLDLYRVTRVAGLQAEVVPIRGGEPFALHITGPFLRDGDRILGRVVEFRGLHFMADTPYLLEAAEDDWLEYLARVADDAASARPSGDGEAPRPKPRLTSKQAARLRKEQKARAARNAPGERVVRHLRYGPSERFWFDYVMDAAAGARNGVVRLAGVPDRPETWRGDLDEQSRGAGSVSASDASVAPAMSRVRARLVAIAGRAGLFEREERAFFAAMRELGATPALHEADEPLFTAHVTLSPLCEGGEAALAQLRRETTLDAEEQAAAASIERGRFALLRLDRVRLDEGFEAVDLLREEPLRIVERSATRQVALGDLLMGWICEDADGTLRLEGGAAHVPALLARAFGELAVSLREHPPARLPLELLARLVALREHPPLPELCNTSGERLQLATARYAVLDRERALERLGAGGFVPTSEHVFAWVDPGGTLLAAIELRGEQLLVQVNSLERLRAAKERIEAALGDAVKARLATLDGDTANLIAAARSKPGAARSPELDVAALPPEARAQLHDLLLGQIRKRFDEPIPALRDKSLRQAARGRASSADAVSWLREQERILRLNPQLAGLDMRPLWRELGLEYQGLDTDPH